MRPACHFFSWKVIECDSHEKALHSMAVTNASFRLTYLQILYNTSFILTYTKGDSVEHWYLSDKLSIVRISTMICCAEVESLNSGIIVFTGLTSSTVWIKA
jgi:hypothetical protein